MLTVPSVDALRAMAHFTEQPRWRDIDEMLTTEIEAVTKRLIGARDNADVHELRGRLATLRDFQQTARDARSMLVRRGVIPTLS